MASGETKDFIFLDESGDPGARGSPVFLLVAMHLDEDTLHRVRQHMTAFRYHHDVVKELKAQRSAAKLTPQTVHLLDFLADLTAAGSITTTANWLSKATYKKNEGPYLEPGEAHRFRNFQVRLLLERHVARHGWSENVDVVIDRWKMSEEQRRNLEDYLKDNYRLRPRIAHLTMVDSAYADLIQIVDTYARLARNVAEGQADHDESTMTSRLMDLQEITRGLH